MHIWYCFQIHLRVSAIFCPNHEHAPPRQTGCGCRLPAGTGDSSDVLHPNEGRDRTNRDGGAMHQMGRQRTGKWFQSIQTYLFHCVWNIFEIRRSIPDYHTFNPVHDLPVGTSKSWAKEFATRRKDEQHRFYHLRHFGFNHCGICHFSWTLYDHVDCFCITDIRLHRIVPYVVPRRLFADAT